MFHVSKKGGECANDSRTSAMDLRGDTKLIFEQESIQTFPILKTGKSPLRNFTYDNPPYFNTYTEVISPGRCISKHQQVMHLYPDILSCTDASRSFQKRILDFRREGLVSLSPPRR